MKRATTLFVMLLMAGWQLTAAQSTEYISNPERTGQLTDPFPVYEHNGARSISGPFDLDRDGLVEVLVSQHDASGGAVHVIENTDVDTWELVFSTALIDSSSSSSNARHATAGDLDNDGNWEIVYLAGTGYSQAQQAWPVGLYVWEHDGVVGSDNYGTMPASVADFYALDGRDAPSFAYSQQIVVDDVDGDGVHEALVPANGPNANDVMYILSVTPDADFESGGFGTTFETWVIEGSETPRERNIGGGSAYAVTTGDFNGDGNRDISWHSWNSFNFFNWTTNGPDTYVPLAEGDNFQASAGIGDYVSLFGGVTVDIDGDGNDEAFWPAFQSGNISVMDYDQGADVTVVDASTFAYD
ncbi:MAG: VCBS repeat-containing protein, partial [Rhodothermales bacterium]|nr:VCBS repeat-containing protein [Rhodothermales bacterium]